MAPPRPGMCSSTNSDFICLALAIIGCGGFAGESSLMILEKYAVFPSRPHVLGENVGKQYVSQPSSHPSMGFPLTVRQRIQDSFNTDLHQLRGRWADSQPRLPRTRGSRLLIKRDAAARTVFQ